MNRRSYGRSTTIPFDELDDWTKFARTNDVRLPDPVTALDVCRSLYRLAKKTTAEIRSADRVRSDDGIPVDHGTVLAARPTTPPELVDPTVTAERIAIIAAGERLLEKRIVLEKQRTETARWKAQATRSYIPGPSEWSGDGPPRTARYTQTDFSAWNQGIHRVCGHVHALSDRCPIGNP